MADATVCMPWRPADDRIAAYRRVTAFWEHFGYPLSIADSGRGPFHLAKARNAAIKKAETDIVIVADADTIGDIAAITQAVQRLDDNPNQVIWPHTQYRHIPAEYVTHSDLMAAPVDRIYIHSAGGIFVTTKTTYWKLGGMDERFHPVWGYDDTAFDLAAQTLSTATRINATVYSFNHTVNGGRDTTENNPNRARCQLYRFAHRNPAIMAELIK